MTTFTKISDLPTTSTLSDSDKFIVETSTGTKACSRSALREETQITPADIGLGNVDNTHDLDKPISTATQTALDAITTSYLPSATAASVYVTKTDASGTYETQNHASGTYLSKTDAAMYYLTQEDASSIYVTGTEVGSVYISKTEASSIYATKTEISDMLTETEASSVYVSQTDATSIYATKTEALENVTTNTYTVLTTTTQTVLGAINELDNLLDGVETLLSQI